MELLDEHPEYASSLTKIGDNYAFTQEQIDKYNDALADEKKALDEMINPTNVGAEALKNFGDELIQLKQSSDNAVFKGFVASLQELNENFILGEVTQDEFFTKLQENLQELDTSSFDLLDLQAFTNELMPQMYAALSNYFNAVD